MFLAIKPLEVVIFLKNYAYFSHFKALKFIKFIVSKFDKFDKFDKFRECLYQALSTLNN